MVAQAGCIAPFEGPVDAGFEFADVVAAKREASTALIEMASDGLPDPENSDLVIEVLDERYQTVFVARLIFEIEDHE
ncbi:hypothetical protein AX761_15155 [Rhizobium sp. 58]|nr:hypothetical protein AX761_15155 [Rhizobium sp. 58]